MSRALLLVDPQNDFIDGSLPVPGAPQAMSALAMFLETNPDRYNIKIITLDWHPWKHCSFIENGGQWPAHCLAYSQGAAIWPPLVRALTISAGELAFMTKGCLSNKDEYSIFQNYDSARRISDLLKRYRIKALDLCGLAGDVCVLNTLKDVIEQNWIYKLTVLTAFSPSLDGGESLNKFLEQC